MKIWCVACNSEIEARLTNGAEVYPHRDDLEGLPFWVCDSCNNYVGCHHKTRNRTAPLGVIPTPKLRHLRRQIHATIDPLWKNLRMSRTAVYKDMSKRVGWEFHTAALVNEEQAEQALAHARGIVSKHKERIA